MSPNSNLTVHVIDDDDAVREALAVLLTESGFTVRSYRSATEFLAVLDRVPAGCIVSDIRMPGIDGLELQQRLKVAQTNLPLIFITGHGDIPMAVQALRDGAVDFIEKPFDEDVLLDAVKNALESARSKSAESVPNDVYIRLETLTPREHEVLKCLVAGNANKITAFQLGMSIRTVEVHRARIMQKMGARSLSELVRLVWASRGQ
jgi:two-component system, LuxR family, response regulator FixJ